MNDPEKINNKDEFKSIWDLAAGYTYPEKANDDQQWNNMLGKLKENQPVQSIGSSGKSFAWLKIAAAITLLLGAGLIFYTQNNKQLTADRAVTESTKTGELKEMRLTDGSIIKLNAGSSVRVSEEYGSHNRHIVLDGEAHFEVVKNAALPFTVESGKLTVTVLGTGFEVKNYKGEQAQVRVEHGKVRVQSEKSEKILTAGMGTALTDDGTLSELSEQTIFWTSGAIVCKKATVSDIHQALKHRYGKGLVFDKKTGDKIFTGRFDKENSLSDIAGILRDALKTDISAQP